MLFSKVIESVDHIKRKCNIRPEIGIILGSGLGNLAEEVKDQIKISYEGIPHFKKSSVAGHQGRFVIREI